MRDGGTFVLPLPLVVARVSRQIASIEMEARAETFWRREARRTVIRQNTGWWLAAFLPGLAVVSVVFACGLLFLRQAGAVPAGVWAGLGVGVVVAAVVAWARTRAKFFGVAEGFTRLDVSRGLHNRLTAAAAGVGAFPDPQLGGDGMSWRWARVLGPVAGCAALVMSAAWIPVSVRPASGVPMAMPVAWAQLEDWLDALEESAVTNPEAVEDLRAKLEALKEQPAQDWYDHASLEAGENLRDQTAAAIQTLQRSLEATDAAFSEMRQAAGGVPAGELKRMQAAMDRGVDGLASGSLGADRELMQALKDLDPAKARSMSPEQAAAMRARMQAGMKACVECTGGDQLAASTKPGRQVGGKGGVDRGPGTVPLALAGEQTDLQTKAVEAVSNGDLSRALPGDVMGVGQGEHEVDTAGVAKATAGGAVPTAGAGGDTVWRDDFTPDERGILKRFFR